VNILVLGIGNMLLSDEGAGNKAVEDLQQRFHFPPEVEVVDGGTMGLDLLPYLDDRTHLFIIDAVKSGNAPGTMVRLELDNPPAYFRTKISPHQLGLSEVLAVATLTDNLPPKIVLFGIEPKDLSTGLGMSPEVAENIGRLAEMIVDELTGLGLKVEDVG